VSAEAPAPAAPAPAAPAAPSAPGNTPGNIPEYAIHVSRYPRDAICTILRYHASLNGEQLRVYAVGGDGIMFDCLNGLMGLPNTELAIVPRGTGNDFCRSFGAKNYTRFQDISQQVGTSSSIPADVIRCNGHYALNFCALGAEAAALFSTLPLTKRFNDLRRKFTHLNQLFYYVGGVRATLNDELLHQRYKIRADGREMSGEFILLNIANARYYSVGSTVITSAMPNDGILDMLTLRSIRRSYLYRNLNHYLTGNYRKSRPFDIDEMFCYQRARHIEISSPSPVTINLDGEAFFDSGATIDILPGAVNVVNVGGVSYEDAPREDAPREDVPRGEAPHEDVPRGEAPHAGAPRGEGQGVL
jgi:diacylglycerol kinase family enzyme